MKSLMKKLEKICEPADFDKASLEELKEISEGIRCIVEDFNGIMFPISVRMRELENVKKIDYQI